jgi:uncharacterized protein involved in exopolysaccharide biosynthesis
MVISRVIQRSVVRPFWRHKIKAVALFALTVCASIAATVLIAPKYQSEAKLFVRLGRENVAIDPTATLSNDAHVVSTPQVRESEINSAVAIASSRSLIERVVDALGTDAILQPKKRDDEPASSKKSLLGIDVSAVMKSLNVGTGTPRESAIEKVKKNLTVVAVADSSVIRIAYEGKTPESSRDVVKTIVDEFMAENMRLNRTPQSEEFLQEQADRLKGELEKVEAEVRNLKLDAGLSTSSYQIQLLADQISAAETSRDVAAQDIAATRREVAALRASLETTPKQRILQQVAGMPNVGANGMREQLYTLERLEKQLLSTYTPEYIEVRQVQQQIEDARKVLDGDSPTRQEVTEGLNPSYTAMETRLLEKEASLESLQARVSQIDRSLESLGKRRDSLTDADLKLACIDRERSLKETQYRTFASKLVEAQIDRALEVQRISNIGVVQEASLEPVPISPNAIRNILLGILAGCAGAAGVVYLSETLASTVQSPLDIEQRVGIPLLGVVPELRRSQLESVAQVA